MYTRILELKVVCLNQGSAELDGIDSIFSDPIWSDQVQILNFKPMSDQIGSDQNIK